MSILNNSLFLGADAGAPAGYQIQRSLRFNSSDSGFLSRTISSASSTYTLSMWVKRSTITSNYKYLFSSGNAGLAFYNNTDQLYIFDGANVYATTSVYRDTSAWYHILLSVSSNTGAAYVNGNQVLSGKNTASLSTTSNATNIGRYYNSGSGDFYFDGYIADVYLIDGQALTPTSFGEFDATTGVWNPKAYTGSYGTNGFHLDFADNSNNTATTLGKDTSGNGNNWTPNNLSVSNTPVYSNYLTTNAGINFDGSFPTTNAFDGNTATKCLTANNANGTTTGTSYIQFNSPTAFSGNLKVVCDSGNAVYNVSGGSSTLLATNTSGTDGYSLDCGTVTSITSIRVLMAGGSRPAIGAIQINNVTLEDGDGGRGNDCLVDTPTNYGTDTGAGGEVRGSYCTWNPLSKNSALTLANGNLDTSNSGGGVDGIGVATIAASTSKFYWEITINSRSSGNPIIGAVPATAGLIEVGSNNANSVGYLESGSKRINGTTTSYGSSYAANDVVGVALDLDNGAIYFSKNGTWQNSGVPTSGSSKTGAAHTWTGGSVEMTAAIREYTSSCSANFGQRAFAYTAPSGFKALCTQNLPTPTILKGSDYFDTKLYTGNGSTQTISGLGFSPDFVWVKDRTTANSHQLADTVRGNDKVLFSDATIAEVSGQSRITGFTSDGFSVGTNIDANKSSDAFVSWCWDAGSSNATNTSGSITSTVRANASAGFSVVTYTPTSGGTFTVGHGLGVAPSMVIIKSRDSAQSWRVYHSALPTPATDYLTLNATDAKTTTAGYWNGGVTSTIFGLGNFSAINDVNIKFVAYCFAPVSGYSSMGSYVGNGSTDGPFVYTGFRPRWVLIKNSSTSADWSLFDTARDSYNQTLALLAPNLSSSENVLGSGLDVLSNGFKLRRDASPAINNSGSTHIYIAFAENPASIARAR